jgi:ribosome-associated protein
MAAMLVVTPNIRIPLEEIEFSFVRSAGPGGQNVNKLNTKAVLRWPVAASPTLLEAVRSRFVAKYANRLTSEGELVLTSQRFRDQSRNRADCLEKLCEMLLSVAKPPIKRKRTKPTLASRERRLTEKRRRSQHKQLRRHRPHNSDAD